MKRNLYLKSISLEEAHARFEPLILAQLSQMKTEIIETKEAYNKVLVHPIYAQRSVPSFPSAAMDGIAVSSSKTQTASDHKPLLLNPLDYVVVDTGDPVLDPYDCVIMAEDCIESNEGISILKAQVPYENVRPIGEDIVEGELLFPMHHIVDVMDTSVLIASGIQRVEVYSTVRLGIIPTGDEIKNIDEISATSDIIESNSYLFTNWALKAFAQAKTYPIVNDQPHLIEQQLLQALSENDLVIINAGSSAGRDDYTVQIIEKLGTVVVHGVAIKPGKPVILGEIHQQIVIGVPGFPVSAHIIFEQFVYPVLLRLGHRPYPKPKKITAISNRRIVSSLKSLEFVRIKVSYLDGKYHATPLARGAGMMMSVVKSDGYAMIPQDLEGIEANQMVDVLLNKDSEAIKNTLVAIGSHDLMMDIIRNLLNEKGSSYRLSSIHVGSYAGLLALSKHESKLAMTHLLDPEGSYNLSTLRGLFSTQVLLIKGIKRIQGLMVQKGNPLKIMSIHDLLKHRFVNRQRGSGTRVLLDHWLKQEGLNPEDIQGYHKELNTHLAVAASVHANVADVGLGIFAASQLFNLDFIPMGEEDYDFVCYQSQFLDPDIQAFIEILYSEAFKKELLAIGGYRVLDTHEVIEI